MYEHLCLHVYKIPEQLMRYSDIFLQILFLALTYFPPCLLLQGEINYFSIRSKYVLHRTDTA
jgi:hypothetical protein